MKYLFRSTDVSFKSSKNNQNVCVLPCWIIPCGKYFEPLTLDPMWFVTQYA